MRRWKIMSVMLAVAGAGMAGLAGPSGAGAGPLTCDRTITIADAEASEGSGTMWFAVTLTATGCDSRASAQYETQPSTGWLPPAQVDDDYQETVSELSWSLSGSGAVTKMVGVPILQDMQDEADEVFMVRLFNPVGAEIGDQWATGTILDDDPTDFPYVAIHGDDGTPDCKSCDSGDPCEFTVGLSMAIAQPVTVNYATINGTALAGVDFFDANRGSMTIPAGATRATFTIDVFANSPGEPSELFEVVLTRVSAGTIGHGRVEVHIPADG